MKRLIIIGLIALVLTSCVIQVGHGYYDEDLSYYNEAMLYQVCDLGQLEVSVSGAEIELEGSDDEIIDLVVGFNECRPGMPESTSKTVKSRRGPSRESRCLSPK